MSLESVKMSDTITDISAEIEIEQKTNDRKFQSLAINSMEN
jgi:hypothetical protein